MNKKMLIAIYVIVAVLISVTCIFRISDIQMDYKEEEYYTWAFHQTSVGNLHFFTSEIGYLTYTSEEAYENTNYILLVNNNKTVKNNKDDYIVEVICFPEQTEINSSENSECFQDRINR